MRRIVPSILAIVTGSFLFCVQTRSAEPPGVKLKAREKRTVDFFRFFKGHVTAGVVTGGTRSEVPIGITEALVKPPDEGLHVTVKGPDLVFQSSSKVARTFAVTVKYQVQVMVLQRFGRGSQWVVAPGGPQPRTLEVKVGVSLPRLDPVVVEEGKEVRVSLPRPATNPQPAPRSSPIANVTVDGEAIVIRGKTSGAISWDIDYQVETF